VLSGLAMFIFIFIRLLLLSKEFHLRSMQLTITTLGLIRTLKAFSYALLIIQIYLPNAL